MYGPRRVTLTEAERRKLRVMEQALTAEDPALGALLDGTAGAAAARRRARRVAWLYIVTSVLLFLIGLGAGDSGLTSLGGVLVFVAPAVVVCIRMVGRRWPPPGRL
jgi:DUF3040 family protein